MDLGTLIRNKRIEAGLTLDEVAGQVGYSKPYLSTIETGKVKNPPSVDLLEKLEKVLAFEMGSLVSLASMERIPEDMRRNLENSQYENERLRTLLKTMLSNKQYSKDVSRLLDESNIVLEQDAQNNRCCNLIPVINRVSAGYPSEFNDLDYPVGFADDYVKCPGLTDPNAFAVRVVGDSMQPNFTEGDIIVFSPALEVRNGDDCFVRLCEPHETTFKRVFFEDGNFVRLQPRNEKYSPLIVPGNRINGVYRAVIKYQVI